MNLPVPKLEDTLERYVKAVTPIMSPSELGTTKKAVAEFAAGAGPALSVRCDLSFLSAICGTLCFAAALG